MDVAFRPPGAARARVKAALVAVALGIALPGCGSAESPQTHAARTQPGLDIETTQGVRHFTVEVVTTPEAQAQGLMFRKSLASDAGMLFAFGADAPRAFWMKNTILPLDMIFIRSNGEIVAIAENTVPYSLKPVAPHESAAAVLEVNAGTVARLGIKRGDIVHHPAIAARN
jgi:uncharacterized membrane protein (UPF0127 family)